MATVLQSSMKAKEDQLREHNTKNKTFPEKRENFAVTSQLVVDRSNNRIVHEKARKIVEDAKKDIRQDVNMKRNVNDLDENNTERFQEQVNQIVLERTKKMEESLKSAIECEQDELKAYVKELFKKSFPDITPTGINESRNKHVDINLRDAAKESGRDISVGFVNESCGSARKMLTGDNAVAGVGFSSMLTGGAMWLAGASAFAIAAPVVAVAAGTVACGYGLKKGLDWNKDRLDTNQRKQSAENTAKFVESKLEEVQKKSSDVMKRYSKESIQPYLDVLDNFQRGQEKQKRELKSEIDRVKQLLEKVRIIRMEMSKTEKNLADFNEKFLSNEKIILNDTFLLDAKFLSNEGIFARLFNYVVQFFSPRTTN
ncbi:uncharacterized protein [Asterias amurensis]|uniref:uncharacterized protein n=1 Tax=Asterias amurensis TaxID=7602 RepID=UPI003AB17627